MERLYAAGHDLGAPVTWWRDFDGASSNRWEFADEARLPAASYASIERQASSSIASRTVFVTRRDLRFMQAVVPPGVDLHCSDGLEQRIDRRVGRRPAVRAYQPRLDELVKAIQALASVHEVPLAPTMRAAAERRNAYVYRDGISVAVTTGDKAPRRFIDALAGLAEPFWGFDVTNTKIHFRMPKALLEGQRKYKGQVVEEHPTPSPPVAVLDGEADIPVARAVRQLDGIVLVVDTAAKEHPPPWREELFDLADRVFPDIESLTAFEERIRRLTHRSLPELAVEPTSITLRPDGTSSGHG